MKSRTFSVERDEKYDDKIKLRITLSTVDKVHYKWLYYRTFCVWTKPSRCRVDKLNSLYSLEAIGQNSDYLRGFLLV